MYYFGDLVKVNNLIGRIIDIHQDKRIGLNFEGKRVTTYSIKLEGIPEDDIELLDKQKENTNGTDSENTKPS